MWRYDCSCRGFCGITVPRMRESMIYVLDDPLITQSLPVTCILFPYIHNPPHWEFICFCLLPHWHKLIIQAKSCIVYLRLHPTSALGPIINHLEGPVSTFSSPEEWTDIGPRRPLSSPFLLLSLDLSGAPHAADSPLPPRILPALKISVLSWDDHE